MFCEYSGHAKYFSNQCDNDSYKVPKWFMETSQKSAVTGQLHSH